MTMEELVSMVANLGFPICVAGYLLVRMENKMDTLTTAINNLSHSLTDKSFKDR